jgi:hypothetical protein
MNYLHYAFYTINIYLEKVIEDFRWGIPVRVNLAIWPRVRKFSVDDTGSSKGCTKPIT